MNLYHFIRHAEPLENGHLSSRGIHLAEKCAVSLQDFPKIDLICVSNAVRTLETARVIKKKLNLESPIITLNEFSLINDSHSHDELIWLLNKHCCHAAYLKIKELEKDRKAQVILIVGHAHRVNLLGLEFKRDCLFLNNFDLSHASGFYIKRDLDGTFWGTL